MGIDASDDDIGIGHGRLCAAAPVRCRTGLSTRAAWSDFECASWIEPGNAATASADLDDIDDGHSQRVASGCRSTFNKIIACKPDRALFDQRGLGCCAADIQRNTVRLPYQLANHRCTDHATHGSRFNQLNRSTTRRLKARDTPVGLHRVTRLLVYANLVESRRERIEIASCHRFDIGIQHGSTGTWEFAPLVGQLVGSRNINLRPLSARDLNRSLFVCGIGVGVQETDSDGLDTQTPCFRYGCPYIIFHQWRQDFTFIGDAFCDLQAQLARDKRSGLGEEKVVEVRSIGALDFEHIAEAACSDQSGPGPFALGQRIDDDSGAVGQKLHAAQIGLFHHRNHALFKVRGRRRGLFQADLPGCFIEVNEVGKGTANVNSCSRTHVFLITIKRSTLRLSGGMAGAIPPGRPWGR